MDAVYSLGEASAADVQAGLPEAPSYTTVRTLLRILEEKGFLTHKSVGKKFVYRATRQRQVAGRSALNRLLNVYFGGSLESAIAAHLNGSRSKLDPEELDAISRMIDKAKRESQS